MQAECLRDLCRLARLAFRLCGARVRRPVPGVSLAPLGRGWLNDVTAVAIEESEKIAEMQEEQEEEALRLLGRG